MILNAMYDVPIAKEILPKSGQSKRKHKTTSALEIAEQFVGNGS